MFFELEKEFGKKAKEPEPHEFVWHAFWDKGISLVEFDQLPLPYILSIMQTQHHINAQMEKERKRK